MSNINRRQFISCAAYAAIPIVVGSGRAHGAAIFKNERTATTNRVPSDQKQPRTYDPATIERIVRSYGHLPMKYEGEIQKYKNARIITALGGFFKMLFVFALGAGLGIALPTVLFAQEGNLGLKKMRSPWNLLRIGFRKYWISGMTAGVVAGGIGWGLGIKLGAPANLISNRASFDGHFPHLLIAQEINQEDYTRHELIEHLCIFQGDILTHLLRAYEVRASGNQSAEIDLAISHAQDYVAWSLGYIKVRPEINQFDVSRKLEKALKNYQ